MKTEQDRQQLIKEINVLLHQAYDSTLDEIYALLKRIDDIEDEEDLLAIEEAREDIRINGTVSWEEIEEDTRTLRELQSKIYKGRQKT
jgi:phytoene/squalene synthetase